MTYLYLHGLGSNGNSSTAAGLRDAGLSVVAPNYFPHNYDNSIQQLLAVINQNQITHLVGTSMGGYYALKLSELTGLPAFAVNSCFEPAMHLQKYLSQPALDYSTQQPIIITQKMLDQFKPLNSRKIVSPTIIIGKQDDIIPAFYQELYCHQQQWGWISTDWGHRVGDKTILAQIVLSESPKA